MRRLDRADLLLAGALACLTVLSRRFLYVLPIDRRPVGYAGYTLVRDR